ncbi:DUF4129 domain-containing transglutaminase family protein [Paenibacillus lutrae]|uniref:DUF4129 domain-containing protein n=1 Tax=Paenibacillus lutrae TaxID=2078573 RepID=A0A7X3JZ62_9BACL|nr:transglutaminase domain-containing protein [Paenibacillus lutrae]MVO99737.1 DUF4129 domain-containing protein [Paenibacillus lutrae]
MNSHEDKQRELEPLKSAASSIPSPSSFTAGAGGFYPGRTEASVRCMKESTPGVYNPSGLSAVRNTALTIIWFLLLLEWLRPMASGIGMIQRSGILPYALLIGYFLMLSAVVRSAYVLWLGKLAGITITIGYFYRNGNFPWGGWPVDIGNDLYSDLGLAAAGRFGEISWVLETLLFLIGSAAFISASHQLLLHRQHGAWFAAATGGYLVVLQIWAGIDTTPGLIRTAALGLLLLALLTIPRLRRRFAMSEEGAWPLSWIGLSLAAAAALYMSGIWAHEGGKFLPMRTSSVRAAADGWVNDLLSGRNSLSYSASRPSESAVSLTGYGEDDTWIGGPILPDNRIAFKAKTPVMTYWRGESKSFYDGKGWSQPYSQLQPAFPVSASGVGESQFGGESSAETGKEKQEKPGDPDLLLLNSSGLLVQEITEIAGKQLGTQIFAGGTVQALQEAVSISGKHIQPAEIRSSRESGKVTMNLNTEPLKSYRIAITPMRFGADWLVWKSLSRDEQEPVSDAELRSGLRGSAGSWGVHGSSPAEEPELSGTELAAFLQLPGQLPQRVKDLAASLTADHGEDKLSAALAIERHLRTGYRYSMSEPKRPADEQDAVDHFLFTSGVGYCDHFSTSMVVLLRSAGIPARWVKGFAPGEAGERAPDGSLSVIVRSRDAHSWAEAYIPGAGWLAFEPTPGFASPPAGGKEPQAVPASVSLPPDEAEQPGTTLLPQWAGALLPALARAAQSPAAPAVAAALAVLAAALMLRRSLMKRRGNALAPRLTAPLRRSADSTALMERLWLRVFRSHGRLAPQQTLREYVAALGGMDDARRRALEEFAALYEEVRYDRSGAGIVGKGRILEIWKRIEG